MDNQCNYESIQESIDKCLYVQRNCTNQQKIAFTQVFYCQLNENYTLVLLLIPFFFFMMFNLLSKTAENYLSPAVTHIAKYFKLSQTLSGITLIALANGAPDVITAIIATGEDDQGVLIAVGSIFGSGLFMTTFVLGSVLYYSNHILVNKVSLTRDLVFNILGIGSIITFGYIGYISIQFSILFVSLYLVYIFIVMLNEKSEIKHCQENMQLLKKQGNQEEQQALLSEDEFQQQQQTSQQQNDDHKPFKYFGNEQQSLEFEEQQINLYLTESCDNEDDDLIEIIPFQKQTIIQKLQTFQTLIFDLISKYTEGKKQQNKIKTSIQLLFTPLLLLVVLDIYDYLIFNYPLWLYVECFTIIIVLYHNYYEIPLIFLIIWSAICSIVWCKLIVEILVDFIVLIQILTGISPSYLGMTFLAFGNSACDFLVNTQLAKMGLGIMAITGCFAGAFFNLNVGFGIALLKQTWNGSNIQFQLFLNNYNTNLHLLSPETTLIIQLLLFFSLLNMTSTLLLSLILKFQLKKQLSYYYFIYYFIVLITLTMITFFVN
ncbi:unnamed protein product [Paramecium sonneborni]|uniref:Sodium/calcium exchanger membrane region domain-containing protein n=1 Tax=Paramecium sonneborni TaxID=65129 RepID=A0A8S1QSJ6_9CILI|nr:unnamed protein product [Paramecium sonneborni]